MDRYFIQNPSKELPLLKSFFARESFQNYCFHLPSNVITPLRLGNTDLIAMKYKLIIIILK